MILIFGLRRTYLSEVRLMAIENILSRDARNAINYATGIASRFPVAEREIAKQSWHAYYYATGVMKTRWPAAEPVIRIDPYAWNLYREYFKL